MVSQSSGNHVGNLRPPGNLNDGDKFVRYSASASRAAMYRFVSLSLHVPGSVVDTVAGLAGSRNFDLVQSSGRHSMQTLMHLRRERIV